MEFRKIKGMVENIKIHIGMTVKIEKLTLALVKIRLPARQHTETCKLTNQSLLQIYFEGHGSN